MAAEAGIKLGSQLFKVLDKDKQKHASFAHDSAVLFCVKFIFTDMNELTASTALSTANWPQWKGVPWIGFELLVSLVLPYSSQKVYAAFLELPR